MRDGTVNILIGGEAGQGIVTIGRILARSMVRSGYSVLVTKSYHSRIRGGHNTFAIRAGAGEVLAPRESVDILVALNAQTVDLHREELASGGVVIVDEPLAGPEEAFLGVPFKELAEGKYVNVAALGVVGSLVGLDREVLSRTLHDILGKKDSEKNRAVLKEAFQWCEGKGEALHRLPPVKQTAGRLMLNGNEAIALGALSAGLKLCAFYPMSPATSISLTLVARAERMGLIVEQVEDEISAINMAIGASFAGAPSMVATSGGGFALMVEGVSLAAMTETPIVIVVAQRPGPATGLPTRTEQGDLELVLHAGHGEFPRAIFSPGTVEECFHLTRRAFALAEEFQGPIFLLTDQFLADSSRAVEPFDVEHLSYVVPGARGSASTPYRRYEITEDGVSPRLFPGMTENLVVADSDEHTEDGHITEDLSIRVRMVLKRLRKGRGIREAAIPPEMQGDEKPEILLVSWGSTRGSVLEAAAIVRSGGDSVASMHFPQVWPLAADRFLGKLEGAGNVICVEGNATGQLARLIRRETGFHIEKRLLRYDGLPITPAWILRELQKLL